MFSNIQKTFFVLALILVTSVSAQALTIVQVSLGGQGNGFQEIQYVGSALSTISDGNAATLGDQDTNVFFDGYLSGVADISSGASFSLSGILASGAPSIAGVVVSQNTAGGTFNLYNSANTLLLSGTLGSGLLSGSDTGSVGSMFTTSVGNFTAGSLLGLLPAQNSLFLTLALSNIQTAGSPGLDVAFGIIQNFSGNGQVSIDSEVGAAVPEPFTLGLLLTGTLAGALVSRRKLS